MFSLKKGIPVAQIKGRGNNSKKIVYLKDKSKDQDVNENLVDISTDKDMDDLFNNLEINYGLVEPIPNTKVDRESIFIAGPAGSGKSYFSGRYMDQYHKKYPDNPIVIFSRKSEDPAIDNYEWDPIRIQLDEEYLYDPVLLEDLENTCVLFDDIDTFPKDIRESVQHLRDDILEVGRSFHITTICTSHQLMNYKSTRVLLNEATQVVFFPKSGSQYHIKRFLKVYCGLDKDQIKDIINLPSRWIMINKSYPMYVMYSFGCKAICNE